MERLQGTDGVRRPVMTAAEAGAGPLEAFLSRDVMTEEFFELYCYAQVSLCIEKGIMEPGDGVPIGWDGRDTGGQFTGAAIDGIAKAGGQPLALGVIPTPGVAIALVCKSAATAFMITASHNPRDQNGIKIFNSPGAAKPLPDEDRELTRRIFSTDYAAVKAAAPKYRPADISAWAREGFIRFHLDPRNAWTKPSDGLFAETALVVDAAHGAMAGLAAPVFSELGFFRVAETAGEQNGDVNRDSGVAFLEGVREISGQRFDTDAGLARHKLVKAMFGEGRATRAKPNGPRLAGVAFDADGDRFFLLWYDMANDSLHVLSGDESAALQAEYLMKTEPERHRGKIFACTVESDINAARHVAALGMKPEIMAVGDKWILHRANGAPSEFGLGAEETGHSIHGGVVPMECGAEYPLFAGNGLKGAINTLVAAHHLGEGDTARMEALLKRPFEPGFKKSLYSYYIDKGLFHRGSAVWEHLCGIIAGTAMEADGEVFSFEPVLIADEPDMLFVRVAGRRAGEVASIFIRNSGTEDKISVNVRGPIPLGPPLTEIAEAALAHLMKSMKDRKNPMASAEAAALEGIAIGIQPEPGAHPGVDLRRLLYEMEIKQKLVTMEGGKYTLTPMGRRLAG